MWLTNEELVTCPEDEAQGKEISFINKPASCESNVSQGAISRSGRIGLSWASLLQCLVSELLQ
jgi:hypothetical protein